MVYLTYPHIKVNDILSINSEKIQVLNIEPEFSRIRALEQLKVLQEQHIL